MCGFAGVLTGPDAPLLELTEELPLMGDTIAHRGPDSSGTWVDESGRVGLVHRRLAIQDLSPLGHQPMVSACGRYVIAFNGEIYNFQELRSQLSTLGFSFKGGSDTEVMLAAIEAWGVERALQSFVGMFAFALWDKNSHSLYLARDRLGEKPLYYGWNNGAFLFGSELKALRAFSGWQGEVDRGALCLLLRHNYIPAPHSIYRGIEKLLPGTYLRITNDGGGFKAEHHVYWSVKRVFERGLRDQLSGSVEAVSNELEALLFDSVSQKMISDVPLGAFLSGGIDSSLIVSLMQRAGDTPVKTFTIGFDEPAFNEAELAKEVAAHLGTDHTELYVSPEDALNVIPRISHYYDEPFADSSQIPTFMVSEMAKRKVTVVLSGDGGDEFFCGYSRYFGKMNHWRKISAQSPWVRKMVAGSILAVPDFVYQAVSPLVSGITGKVPHSLADRVRSRVGGRMADSMQEYYRHSISYWKRPEDVVINAVEPRNFLSEPGMVAELGDSYSALMCLDAGSYLPDDILVKVDRAAMAHSLEGRIPLLDHRVIEYASRIPAAMNVKDGVGKQLLRNILYKHVPQALVDRPKVGFAAPVAAWLRGPLRDWAESLLDESRLKAEGFFHPAPIRVKWQEHVAGKNDWSFYLWGILVFQSWLEEEHSRSGGR